MAREIKMRIRSLEMVANQKVQVDGIAVHHDRDEEVTFLLHAKDARGLYIGQALTVTVAAEDDTEAIPQDAFQMPRSPHPTVITLYNVWRTPKTTIQSDVNRHVELLNAVRTNWPELGKAIDAACAVLDQ